MIEMVTKIEEEKIKTFWFRCMLHNYAMMECARNWEELQGHLTHFNLIIMKETYDWMKRIRSHPKGKRGNYFYEEPFNIYELGDYQFLQGYQDYIISIMEEFMDNDKIFDLNLKALLGVMYDIAGCGYDYKDSNKRDIEREIIELAKNSEYDYF